MTEKEIAQMVDCVNAIKAEREMCANICDRMVIDALSAGDKEAVAWLKAVAMNIRKRGGAA